MENLLFAWRYLLKFRGNILTRVISLSLGLAVGLLLFSYAYYQLTMDRNFRDGDRVFQMWSQSEKFGLSGQLNAPIAPTLVAEMSPIEAATRLRGPIGDDVVRGDNTFGLMYIFADTLFFETLGFEVLRGNPKEILQHENQTMLSESAAKKIFGEKDPLGQLILLRGTDSLTVSGIFRDPPVNQHLGAFEMLCAFDAVKESLNTSWDGGDSFATYIKIRPGASIAQVEELTPAFALRHQGELVKTWGVQYRFFPIADSSRVVSPLALIAWILMALAALTLFIATMNYVLASISTLVSRSKTLAMLKVGGARRRDIFSIFCWETLLLICVSLLLALFLIWGLQSQVEQITSTRIGDLFALARIWVPLCVIVAAFTLAALIPAQIFTAVPVTLAFRGVAANRRRWKQVLLFAEVLSVTLVIVLLTVFYLQFNRLRNGDFGFEHDHLTYTLVNAPVQRGAAICNDLASLPEVESAAATEEIPLWGFSGQPCYDEVTGELLFSCRYLICDERFIPVMGMQLAAGRNFTPVSSPEEALVNETYVRLRGWTNEEAVGRRIAQSSDPTEPQSTVVGVVKDFRTGVIDGRVEPIVIHPCNMLVQWLPETRSLTYYILIRLRELTPESLAAVQRKIEQYPSGNNHVLEVYDNRLTAALSDIRSYRNIVLTVCCIVLLITLTGLVGYLSDEIRRRGKEIAVRKVNGASAWSVVRLLARDIALLCLPAMAVGVAVSYWCVGLILSMFVEQISLRWWIFCLCVVAVTLVIGLVIVIRTWRIANADPVRMLKTE